jgi:hypothetical protein
MMTSLGIDRYGRRVQAQVTYSKDVGVETVAYEVHYLFTVPRKGAFVGSETISSRPGKQIEVEYDTRNPEHNRLARGESAFKHVVEFIIQSALVSPFLLIGIGCLLSVIGDLRWKGRARDGLPLAPPARSVAPTESAARQTFGDLTLEPQGERLLIYRSSTAWKGSLGCAVLLGVPIGAFGLFLVHSILTGSGEVTVNGRPLSQASPEEQRLALIMTGAVGLLIALFCLAFVGHLLYGLLVSFLQSRVPVVLDRSRGLVFLGRRRLGLLGAIRAVQVESQTDEDGNTSYAVALQLYDEREEQQREQLPTTVSKWASPPLAAAITLYAAYVAEDWSWWNLLTTFFPSYFILGLCIAFVTFLLQKLPQLFRPTSAQRLRMLGLHRLLQTQKQETAERLAHLLAEFLAVPVRRTP